jgi:hypothetical protein
MSFATIQPRAASLPGTGASPPDLPPFSLPPSSLGHEGPHAHANAERALMDAVERALRLPHGKFAMALRLSRLKPPAPRPYHTRIAHELMQDAAHRLGGQVYALRNADLVLLAQHPADGRAAPFTLPQSLQTLFGVDAPEESLTTIWHLDQHGAGFRDYMAQIQAEPTSSAPFLPTDPGSSHGLAALSAWLAAADPRALLMQQTAVQLRPGRGLPLAVRLAPLFREIVFTPAAVQACPEAILLADPAILRHLEATLHARILGTLLADLQEAGPLTRPALLLGLPIHLNLSPASIVSAEFARLAQLAAARGARFGIGLAAPDIAADPSLTAFACALLRQAGFPLILGRIDHAGLTMLRPQTLAPAFVKLVWSPRMEDGSPSLLAPLDAAIDAIGPSRIVLQDSDGEAALLWGQSRGITAFQGPYMDAVQAASRIAICPVARACTLRQCTNRALSLHLPSRMGCGNPGLLDMPAFTDAPA